jgi:hypothetical protein
MDKTVDFINHTGIWTDDPTRAPEIWLQNATDKMFDSYLLERYKSNRSLMQPDLDALMQNIMRQLIFYLDGNLVLSDLMVDYYLNNRNNEIYVRDINDLIFSYTDELLTDGYILGPYKEILTLMTDKENLKNDIFNIQISSTTEDYLKSIEVNMNLLITIAQRILTANGSIYLGIDEGDFQSIFGIQSVSKALLQNIANNY